MADGDLIRRLKVNIGVAVGKKFYINICLIFKGYVDTNTLLFRDIVRYQNS